MDKIPFNEVQFRNSAVALDEGGKERVYAGASPYPTDCDFTTKLEGMDGTFTPMRYELNKWSMKPQPVDAGQDWIKHSGSTCPIPWATYKDFECKDLSGDICESSEHEDGNEPASDASWRYISAFRLTQGWLPVKGDGTIPDAIKGAKAGEWEFKTKGGTNVVADLFIPQQCRGFKHSVQGFDIVAVRLVAKKEGNPAPWMMEQMEKAAAGVAERPQYMKEMAHTRGAMPILPIHQNEMLRIAGEAMREGTKGGGPFVACDVIARLMR